MRQPKPVLFMMSPSSPYATCRSHPGRPEFEGRHHSEEKAKETGEWLALGQVQDGVPGHAINLGVID